MKRVPRSEGDVCCSMSRIVVLVSRAERADALATALMVLGSVDGPAYAERNEIAALFIIRDGAQLQHVMSSAMAAMT